MEKMVDSTWRNLRSVYEGKRIFLTGHTGFKGSWLLKVLSMLGAEVKGYSLSPQVDFSLYTALLGDTLCHSVIADLRDKVKLTAAMTDFQPDFVFHLAAQPLVRLSYDLPAETFEINAIGTANVLDALKLLNKPCRAIMITTDKVYHNYEWIYPYRENDRLGGFDPYSASKACMELVIDSYRNSFFNSANYSTHQKGVAVARAGNVIGGGDWAKDRLLPDIIRALYKNERIEIRNPNSIRPWQHVLEPLLGYLILGTKLVENPLTYSQAYNFGPNSNDALPVHQMVNLAIESWGNGEFFVSNDTNQPHEASFLKLDISKATHWLGWKPKFNATQALKYTVDWYKQFFSDKDTIIEFTEQQIIDFI